MQKTIVLLLLAHATAFAQTPETKKKTSDPWKEPSTIFPGKTKLEEWQQCSTPFIKPWNLDSRCPNYNPNKPPPPKSIVTCERSGSSVTCFEY